MRLYYISKYILLFLHSNDVKDDVDLLILLVKFSKFLKPFVELLFSKLWVVSILFSKLNVLDDKDKLLFIPFSGVTSEESKNCFVLLVPFELVLVVWLFSGNLAESNDNDNLFTTFLECTFKCRVIMSLRHAA